MATKTATDISRNLDKIEAFLKERGYTGDVLEWVDDIREVNDETKDEISKLEEQISDLQSEINGKEEEPELTHSIRTTDEILWSASNLADVQVMEALEEAYQTLTPVQIQQRLKV